MKPNILFLSHCCPTLPDKGERIRAFHELQYLACRYRVHVACFAREYRALQFVDRIKPLCASFYCEVLDRRIALPLAGIKSLLGNSLTVGYFASRGMRQYIEALSREVRLSATLAFSSVMARYAPQGVPLLLDMVDVDSAKWAVYAERRRPGRFFALEAERLRGLERRYSQLAGSVLLTTEQEMAVFRGVLNHPRVRVAENGVDADYFNPEHTPADPALAGRRYAVMVGAMDYYPNSDGAVWFATRMFPVLREKIPGLEFLIVGHTPSHAVWRLRAIPGITVTGYVPDVRPYIANSLLSITPLRIARGVQNKVLEALTMGKMAAVSPEVAKTFGPRLPHGLHICDTAEAYVTAIRKAAAGRSGCDPEIRAGAMERFSWERTLLVLNEELLTIGQ